MLLSIHGRYLGAARNSRDDWIYNFPSNVAETLPQRAREHFCGLLDRFGLLKSAKWTLGIAVKAVRPIC
jgi:hypothetical protein